MKPVLVGQAPGPNTDPELPLYPVPARSAGGRLQRMLGLSRAEYLRLFERTNLLYRYVGTTLNGDRVCRKEARVAAGALQPLLQSRVVVLVGRKVADAFDFHEEFFVWRRVGNRSLHTENGWWGCIPHPSGRNRLYNDEETVRLLREFFDPLL